MCNQTETKTLQLLHMFINRRSIKNGTKVKLDLSVTEHLFQVPWIQRTSWERLRSWRGCGTQSWSSCMRSALWRSLSTSSQSWWRTAACWSTSRVRCPHVDLQMWLWVIAPLWRGQSPTLLLLQFFEHKVPTCGKGQSALDIISSKQPV